MPTLDLSLASKIQLSVRRFSAHEGISSLYEVSVWAMSHDPSVDLDAIVGKDGAFEVATGYANAHGGGARRFAGMVSVAEQLQAEPTGLSTYFVRIVPKLWRLTQRRGYRIFQHLTIPDILEKLLGEHGLKPDFHIDKPAYPKLEYKVQYGESDYAFFCRLCEEAGVAFTFPAVDESGDVVVLGDALHLRKPRSGPPVPWVDKPNEASEKEFATHIRISHEVRPGALVVRDYDFRNPSVNLLGEAEKAEKPEDKYEQFHYKPGSFLVETGKPGNTPSADDRGFARYDARYGEKLAGKALYGLRSGREAVRFETNAFDLAAGAIFAIEGHPNHEIDPYHKLLITHFAMEGAVGERFRAEGRAVFADVPYRPAMATPKPRVYGVQSATVVGPKGQEIHTDEFGRVRVELPWDREGTGDDGSSCWVRVSQGWGGKGYGMIVLPRIGQEVLIGFLNGDPDQPMVVGRLYNRTSPVPYKLPDNKTVSTWKSDSSQGSNGFNEIKFEDKKADELVYQQAEKNQRTLVKHDETITVLHDRDKHVGVNEFDTTGVNRIEVTGITRTETTGANRLMVIGGDKRKLVGGSEVERTEGNRLLYVGKNLDAVIKKSKREQVDGDVHLFVKGSRKERVDGTQSLVVHGDQHEQVSGRHALEAGSEIHLVAGEVLMGEGARDVTLKGAGGFVRIDAAGVTIKGTLVKINAGGSPRSGKGSKPEEPAKAKEAEIEEPDEIDTDVTVDKQPGKAPTPEPKKPTPKPDAHEEAPAETCELKKLEVACEHEGKRKFKVVLPPADGTKKPYDVLEVLAGDAAADPIKATITMAKPRCALHKDAIVIQRPDGKSEARAEETITYPVKHQGIVIERDVLLLIWPWNRPPVDYRFTARACRAAKSAAVLVRVYPALEVSFGLKLGLNTDDRIKEKIGKAQGAGRVEKRGRPAHTDWELEIKGEIKYGDHKLELSRKFENKIKDWAAFNRLIKRAIDKFTELFYTYTGVTILPEFPSLALSYEGKFKEIEKSWKVGSEWSFSLKLDPLIGITAKLDILDVMISALEKTQFAVIARGLKKVKDFAKSKGQVFEIYLSFGGRIAGEIGAKKKLEELRAGPFGEVKGEVKVEFGAKASFGSQSIVSFKVGAEAKASTGLGAKLQLDSDKKGAFLKGKLYVLACKFQYSVYASGKFIWEIKESYEGEYTFWEDTDFLKSGDHYVLQSG